LTWEFLLGQFAAQFGLWWVILPAILLGIVVGILPGFSPQNTLIMLLPLAVVGTVTMVLSQFCTRTVCSETSMTSPSAPYFGISTHSPTRTRS
jgi:hypothetical protein